MCLAGLAPRGEQCPLHADHFLHARGIGLDEFLREAQGVVAGLLSEQANFGGAVDQVLRFGDRQL